MFKRLFVPIFISLLFFIGCDSKTGNTPSPLSNEEWTQVYARLSANSTVLENIDFNNLENSDNLTITENESMTIYTFNNLEQEAGGITYRITGKIQISESSKNLHIDLEDFSISATNINTSVSGFIDYDLSTDNHIKYTAQLRGLITKDLIVKFDMTKNPMQFISYSINGTDYASQLNETLSSISET